MILFSTSPSNQLFHLDGVKHILPAYAHEIFESNHALAIDVREYDEIVNLSIDCPQLLIYPLQSLNNIMEEIPKDTALVVICDSGIRSAHAVDLLQKNGFICVYNLDGGMNAWIDSQLPTAGRERDTCCKCN
jgi:rhodanese-related sulfurtransferase